MKKAWNVTGDLLGITAEGAVKIPYQLSAEAHARPGIHAANESSDGLAVLLQHLLPLAVELFPENRLLLECKVYVSCETHFQFGSTDSAQFPLVVAMGDLTRCLLGLPRLGPVALTGRLIVWEGSIG